MTKKINLKKVATTIPDDVFISHIDGLIGKVKNVVLECKFIDMKTCEIEDTILVFLNIKDSSGEMPAMIVGDRDSDFQSVVESINNFDTFHIRGNVILLEDGLFDDYLQFMKDIKSDKIFCILALENLKDNNFIM